MMMACALILVLGSAARAAQEGLVGHYTFGAGAEAVLRDMSGRGNDGTTHGVRLIKGAAGTAMYFKKGDYISFGSRPDFNFTQQVTLTAWVYLTDIAQDDHALIVGRQPHTFGLCEHVNAPYALWYATGWERDFCSTGMSRSQWSHLAASFDGNAMKLYLDGVVQKTTIPTKLHQVDNSGNFAIGGYGFRGILSEVKVFNRALSDQEVQAEARNAPAVTDGEIAQFLKKSAVPASYKLQAKACALYFDRRVDAVVDLSGFPEMPPNARIEVQLQKFGAPSDAKPLQSRLLQDLTAGGEATTSFTALELAAGEYEMRAKLVDAAEKGIGAPCMEKFTWPKTPSWPNQPPGVRPLNCLVTELLNVDAPANDQYEFTNPRDANLGGGWIFISSTVAPESTGKISIAIDTTADASAILRHEGDGKRTQETMRLLMVGKHKLTIRREGKAVLAKLIVRSVPELIYGRFPATAKISQYGPYDWAFLEKYVRDHVNALQGIAVASTRPNMEQWKALGKRWLDSWRIIVSEPGAPLTADKAYDWWAHSYGYVEKLADGTHVDEFHGGTAEEHAAWNEAIRRLHKDFPSKVLYPYCGSIFGAGGLIQTIKDCHMGFAWERYLPEPATEYQARQLVWKELKSATQQWQADVPGCEKNMIVTFGHWMSSVPETIDVNPGADFKVYMDMQFNLLANDPDFFGLYGIELYQSSLADEELVHWGMRLFRHYCIEGKTNMLSDTPYVLTHLQNPDFDEGSQGWTLAPAEAGSIAAKYWDGYGLLQGRWYGGVLPPDNGNHFLWTRRSDKGPNRFSQEVRNLKPGRLYSLKMISANYQDLSVGKDLAVAVQIDNVELLDLKSFQTPVQQVYHSGLGYNTEKNPAWFNFHLKVFRAKGSTAKLTVSDWASEKEPGGPIGQEIIYNYLELQPYLED